MTINMIQNPNLLRTTVFYLAKRIIKSIWQYYLIIVIVFLKEILLSGFVFNTTQNNLSRYSSLFSVTALVGFMIVTGKFLIVTGRF